jgi:histidine triad (HIT) family protein
MDCVFCQIASGKIPSDMVYQDEEIVAFRDIKPLAPVHLIIIPQRHIPSLVHISEADLPLVGRMVAIANRLAKEEGVADSGYRLVINCGKEGGQVVPHLHLHLIGGRTLSGRPG